MPEDLVEGDGYPRLTPEMRETILSGSFADLMDVDLDDARETLTSDEFARQKARDGLADPWQTNRRVAVDTAPGVTGRVDGAGLPTRIPSRDTGPLFAKTVQVVGDRFIHYN